MVRNPGLGSEYWGRFEFTRYGVGQESVFLICTVVYAIEENLLYH